jgi:hypothetical protein
MVLVQFVALLYDILSFAFFHLLFRRFLSYFAYKHVLVARGRE